MVKKLYKHEFFAWIRVFAIIWSITVAVAGMHRLLQLLETESVYYIIAIGCATVMYIVAMLVSLAAPVVFGLARFYRNFFTGEGYLTFTLPVTQAEHLWVKVSTAVAFSIGSFLVCTLSGMVITAGEVYEEVIKAFNYLLREFTETEIMHMIGWSLEFVVLAVVSLFSTFLFYDACICIGQLFRKNRVLAAVGVYFAFYALAQVFSGIASVGMVAASETGVFDKWALMLEKHFEASIHGMFVCGILISVVFGFIYWLICHGILRKRLNLE